MLRRRKSAEKPHQGPYHLIPGAIKAELAEIFDKLPSNHDSNGSSDTPGEAMGRIYEVHTPPHVLRTELPPPPPGVVLNYEVTETALQQTVQLELMNGDDDAPDIPGQLEH